MTISTVTSEALQLKLRQLLPSQQGFGTDLSASDTIIPIIDLTEAAEGSVVSENLTNAICFGSATGFNTINNTQTLANTPGFWRIYGQATNFIDNTSAISTKLELTDGLSSVVIWEMKTGITGLSGHLTQNIDFIVFLATGESFTSTSNSSLANIVGSVRQVADANGVLINPAGFSPQ